MIVPPFLSLPITLGAFVSCAAIQAGPENSAKATQGLPGGEVGQATKTTATPIENL